LHSAYFIRASICSPPPPPPPPIILPCSCKVVIHRLLALIRSKRPRASDCRIRLKHTSRLVD